MSVSFVEDEKVSYIGNRPELAGKHGVVKKADVSGRIMVKFEGMPSLSFVHFTSLTHDTRKPKRNLWDRLTALFSR
jgi:hypothetical protein